MQRSFWILIGMVLFSLTTGWGTLILGIDRISLGQFGGGGTVPAGEIGTPRRWEGGIAISPHSIVNQRSGTVTTIVPLESLSHRTFQISFNLYHNSLLAVRGTSTSNWPGLISPGPGWSTSYSGSVYSYNNGTHDLAVVVEDDGTRNTFQWDPVTSRWIPPAGIHDRLRKNVPQTGWWTLTRTDQTKRVFDGSGLLQEEINTAGLKLLITRNNTATPPYIRVQPEGNFPYPYIDLDLHSSGKPLTIRVQKEVGLSNTARSYTFLYGERDWGADCDDFQVHCPLEGIDAQFCTNFYSATPVSQNSWFNWLLYPDRAGIGSNNACAADDDRLSFRFNTNGTIAEIKERDGNRWTYSYQGSGAALSTIVQHPQTGGAGSITQSFSFCVPSAFTQCFEPKQSIGTVASWTTYTDPRGHAWLSAYDSSRRLMATYDAVTGAPNLFGYDAANNLTSRTDGLNRTWYTTYGPVGNPTSWGTPLANQTTLAQYEVPAGEPSDTNFYRLSQTTDPAGWVTQFFYEQPLVDPTKITRIVEQADGQGNPAAETIMEYAEPDITVGQYNPKGLIASVTDANSVRTQWTYDKDEFGSFRMNMEEGVIPGQVLGSLGIPATGGSAFDTLGNQKTSSLDGIICSGDAGGSANIDGQGANAGCLVPDPFLTGSTLPFAPPRLTPATGIWSVPSPVIPTINGCESNAGLDGNDLRDSVGRLLKWRSCTGDSTVRESNWTYNDPFKRLTSKSITSDEPGFSLTRTFDLFTYDSAGAVTSMRGPDGRITNYEYDFAGRVTRVVRPGMPEAVLAEYFYDDQHRLESMVAGNGVVTFYSYDDVDRITDIQHVTSVGGPTPQIARVSYAWTINNLVASRSEYTSSDPAASPSETVDFTYDLRGRLIREARVSVGTDDYDLSYTYDQVGNRLTKTDNVSSPAKRVRYLYDLDEVNCPPGNVTRNNRLMKYVEETDVSGTGGWVETRNVVYTYYRTGHTSNITVKDAADPIYRDLALYNDLQGRVIVALWDSWEKDGSGNPVNYQRIKAKQFRYDNTDARQRYLLRELDPAALPTITPLAGGASPKGQWVEYDGSSAYADGEYTHGSAGSYSVTKQYDPMSERDVASGDELNLHGDLIGSAIAATDEDEAVVGRQVYTAFGEPISGTGFQPVSSRYRYAGAFGYEDGLLTLDGAPGTQPIALLHLGERWYQPGIGRFVQRDPIGLMGGDNTYVYPLDPTIATDETGMAADNIWRKRFNDLFPSAKALGLKRHQIAPRFNDGAIRVGRGFDHATKRNVFRMAIGGARGGWPFNIHLVGRFGALTGVGSVCLFAWDVGWAAGDVINWVTEKTTGKSLSSRIADYFEPPMHNIPGWYHIPRDW